MEQIFAKNRIVYLCKKLQMKKILVLTFSFLSLISIAQEKQDSLASKHWKIIGQNSLLLNQNSFSNWVAGGNNSFGLNAKSNYEFNYKKNKHIWDNKIILGYGQASNEGDKPRKTDDILSLNSTYGYQIKENYYASAFVGFLSQFAEGYDYGKTPDYSSKDRISAFMSPGYLTVGFGVDYKPTDNFSLSVKPLTSKMTFVLDKKLQRKDNFGLKHDGDSFRYEFGALLGANYKTELFTNVKWTNSLTLYSNYLFHAERIDISYSTALNMKVNDFISTILTLDILYDHDQLKKTQLKQTLGVGFSYNFERK